MLDALVIGGGPAGLSAAIHLARACRSVAVVDCRSPGRSDWAQVNQNYLGFPNGVSIVELCDLGKRQAERFGAQFVTGEINELTRDDNGFIAHSSERSLRSRMVILATGVTDRWVDFPGYESYIGRSLHWCIVCDGFEMQGQRVVVVGVDDHAAELAIQLRGFASHVALLANSDRHDLSNQSLTLLRDCHIPLICQRIHGARANQPGYLEALMLDNGDELACDHLFNAQEAEPNTRLAAALGVELSNQGYIQADVEGRTNVPGLFAAGDVTRLFSHQVLTAAHEGATAAAALDYALYQQDVTAPRSGCHREGVRG